MVAFGIMDSETLYYAKVFLIKVRKQ